MTTRVEQEICVSATELWNIVATLNRIDWISGLPCHSSNALAASLK